MGSFSLIALSGGYSLVSVYGLLFAVASLIAEQMASGHTGFSICRLRALELRLVAVVHGLSCFVACGIFLG